MGSILKVDNLQNSDGTRTIASDSGTAWSWGSNVPAGTVVDVKNHQFGSMLNLGDGTSVQIPYDDNIPQITQGGEVMTLAITPKSTTNKLKIDVIVSVSGSTSEEKIVVALFQDTTTNALACVCDEFYDSNYMITIPLTHFMTAGTTSSTTFKVRCGRTDSNSNPLTINGQGGSRKFGGVCSTCITITEITEYS